jgi:hypothetical protein
MRTLGKVVGIQVAVRVDEDRLAHGALL